MAISSSSEITAVTLKSDERSVLPRSRSTSSETRTSRSSISRSTRSRSEAWIFERRLLHLEVALLQRGPQDHLAADADGRGLRARHHRRHLDREVGRRDGAAGEAPAVLQLGRRERADVEARDRRVALDDAHLALLAGAVPAAGRVDRHGVPARRVEQVDARGHARLDAHRRELSTTRPRPSWPALSSTHDVVRDRHVP